MGGDSGRRGGRAEGGPGDPTGRWSGEMTRDPLGSSAMFIAHPQPAQATAVESILAFLPWLVLFMALWVLLFVILRRSSRRTREEAQRAEAHARAVEAKLDALIEQNRQKPPGG